MYPINGLPPIHPGEYIKEILQETGVSQSAFAKNIGVSPMRITHIIHGRRPVTAELAFLIGKANPCYRRERVIMPPNNFILLQIFNLHDLQNLQ
ncbi:MAG: addiction module antidote protein, HigA family [Desulfobacterales bacterium CG23_combo_of_CG06-09_8_20_14_all_51_8]|nr:MAG: addiction module antidote protein, HigA family [Desulfobacterales bacterium CG23_combo_of_CG06-09_8_20_14_all_51_8]